MLTVISNFITNADEIIQRVIEPNKANFAARREAAKHNNHMGVESKFHTLTDDYLTEDQIDVIFKSEKFDPGLRYAYQFIQIQWYKPGDFIVPHKDTYDVIKLHLVTLTYSNTDGLVCQSGKDLIRILDRPGTKIDFDYDAWHWVDPVVCDRYSLVIGE